MGNDYNSKKKLNTSHASFLKNSKKFKIIGGLDTNRSKRKKFENKFKVKSYSNLESVDLKNLPELFIVSTPSNTHYEILNKISKFKKPILLEKPISDNINNSQKIFNLVKRKKMKIFINYFRNYELKIDKIFKNFSKKKFFCYINYSSSLLENGSHHLNLIQKFLKYKKQIIILNKNLNKKNISPDFKIIFSNGELYMFHNKSFDYKTDNINLLSKDKKIIIDLNPFTFKYFSKKKDIFYNNEYILNNSISENLSKPNKYLNYTYSNIYRYFKNKKYVSPNLLDTLNIEKIIFEILNKAK